MSPSVPSLLALGQLTLAGLLRDGARISPRIVRFLCDLSCTSDVGIHIIAESGSTELMAFMHVARREFYPSGNCAVLVIDLEPDHIAKQGFENRIDRISALRQFQRDEVASRLGGDIIILADLDIAEMPSAEKVVSMALSMIHEQDAPDVLCSAGKTASGDYYDSYATVFLPDTFVYPIAHRMNQESWQDEDDSLILDSDFVGAADLLNWLEELGKNGKDGITPVPVRSCYGGLALYRANIFFDGRCTYLDKNPRNEKYSNRDDMRPCEHVVFHNCLGSIYANFSIAIQPDMQPLYHVKESFVEDKQNTNDGRKLGVKEWIAMIDVNCTKNWSIFRGKKRPKQWENRLLYEQGIDLPSVAEDANLATSAPAEFKIDGTSTTPDNTGDQSRIPIVRVPQLRG